MVKHNKKGRAYYNPINGKKVYADYISEIFKKVIQIIRNADIYKNNETEITFYSPISGKKEKCLKENIFKRIDSIIFPTLASLEIDFEYMQLRVDVGAILNDYIKYKVEGGFLYFNEITRSIDWCDNSVTKAIIPEKINGVEVTSIGGIKLNKTVDTLYDISWAFWGNEDLEEVFIPKSVKKIGWGAFKDCKSLNKLNMEYGVEIIEKSAFEDAFTDDAIINLPNSIKVIDDHAFYFCNCKAFENFRLPKSIEYIGECAFYKISKMNVYFPENIKNIKFIAKSAFDLKNTNFFVYDEALKNYVKYEIKEVYSNG